MTKDIKALNLQLKFEIKMLDNSQKLKRVFKFKSSGSACSYKES
jgi:hypothetical protein